MKIVGIYSFNNGQETIDRKYPHLLKEVIQVISKVSAQKAKTKKSEEKTMPGKMLYNPKALNKAFKYEFDKFKWKDQRVPCEYPTQFYSPDYKPAKLNKGAFREMDFIKEKLGIEVQFGKYAFMVYNVCAKMTIFNKLGFIDAGIEIVPIKKFADQMSTGVSYFEQFVWDLEHRGVSNIDIPVLILGIDK
ncbi:MAG: restriction endonuclease [Ignavibacteria bacterium]|nr:restriction endonuclease [Ignavibacteria bacterium]